MSSDGGGGRSGASRGIQDTNAGDSEACGGDLEEEKKTCVSGATWINWGTYGA